MYAKIFISIFFLLLTAGLQYASWWFHALPAAQHESSNVFLFPYVLPALLLFIAYCQWRKIGTLKKRAWMTENPAPFNPDLIDCYVRFKGKIIEEQTHRLPLSRSECAYYSAAVSAQGKVKKKRPAKGWRTIRKTLLREQSSEEIELADKDYRVYIKMKDFTKSCVELHSRDKIQTQCPPKVLIMESSKFKKFHLTEQFIRHNELMTAQGRLTRNRDGRLFIKPTRRQEFPTLLSVQIKTEQFISYTASEAQKNAWNRRMRVLFLLLNTGLLIYFRWFTA